MTRAVTSVFFGGLAIVLSASMATAADNDQVNEQEPAVELTGQEQSCLNFRNIDTVKPIDDQNFIFLTKQKKAYLNQVGAGCSRVGLSTNRLQFQNPTGRLCRNEIVRVVDNLTGIVSGSCTLSSFQEISQ